MRRHAPVSRLRAPGGPPPGVAVVPALSAALAPPAALGLGALLWALVRRHRSVVCRAATAEHWVDVVSRAAGPWMWQIDARGRFVEASEQCLEWLGYRADEIVGRPAAMLLHPHDADRVMAAMTAEPAAADGWRDLMMHCLTRAGEDRWLLTHGLPVRDRTGQVVGFEGVSVRVHADQEARMRQEASWHRTRRMLDDPQLDIALQPIFDLATGDVVGAEALTRFHGEPAMAPDRWIAEAHAVGLGVDLELLCVRTALAVAPLAVLDHCYLSVNASPALLADRRLVDVIRSSAFPPQRLVLEVTEHDSIAEYDRLDGPLTDLRKLGVRLAVDDAGSGYASFRHIVMLRPEVIKLDQALVRDIDHDAARRALAASLVMFALEVDATVVAEGVETVSEYDAVCTLGFDAAQGYLLGKPTVDRLEWSAFDRLSLT